MQKCYKYIKMRWSSYVFIQDKWNKTEISGVLFEKSIKVANTVRDNFYSTY